MNAATFHAFLIGSHLFGVWLPLALVIAHVATHSGELRPCD